MIITINFYKKHPGRKLHEVSEGGYEKPLMLISPSPSGDFFSLFGLVVLAFFCFWFCKERFESADLKFT